MEQDLKWLLGFFCRKFKQDTDKKKMCGTIDELIEKYGKLFEPCIISVLIFAAKQKKIEEALQKLESTWKDAEKYYADSECTNFDKVDMLLSNVRRNYSEGAI